MEEESWSRNRGAGIVDEEPWGWKHGGSIMEESSLMRKPGGGSQQEAVKRRRPGGTRRLPGGASGHPGERQHGPIPAVPPAVFQLDLVVYAPRGRRVRGRGDRDRGRGRGRAGLGRVRVVGDNRVDEGSEFGNAGVDPGVALQGTNNNAGGRHSLKTRAEHQSC